MANVQLTDQARAQFDGLPVAIKERMHKLFARLADWPQVSGVKSLKGDLAGWHRLRTGDYRLRFHVQGDLVVVDKIGHRKDVYDD